MERGESRAIEVAEHMRRQERAERVLKNIPLALEYWLSEERSARKNVQLSDGTVEDVSGSIESAARALGDFVPGTDGEVAVQKAIESLDEARDRMRVARERLVDATRNSDEFVIEREAFKAKILLHEIEVLRDSLTLIWKGRIEMREVRVQEQETMPEFERVEFLPPDEGIVVEEVGLGESSEHRDTSGERGVHARHLFEQRGWRYRVYFGKNGEENRRTLAYEAFDVTLPDRRVGVFVNDGTEQATYVIRDMEGDLKDWGLLTKAELRKKRSETGRVNWFGVIDDPREWEMQLAHLMSKENERPIEEEADRKQYPWSVRNIRDTMERQWGYSLSGLFVERLAHVLVNHFGESPHEMGLIRAKKEEPSLYLTDRLAKRVMETIGRYRNPDPAYWKTLRAMMLDAKEELGVSFDYETVRKVTRYALDKREEHLEEDEEQLFFSTGGKRDMTLGGDEENPLRLSRYYSPRIREKVLGLLQELKPPTGWSTICNIATQNGRSEKVVEKMLRKSIKDRDEGSVTGMYIARGKNEPAQGGTTKYGVGVTEYISPEIREEIERYLAQMQT